MNFERIYQWNHYQQIVFIRDYVISAMAQENHRNALISVICSIIFTIALILCYIRLGANSTQIVTVAVLFFVGISMVSFVMRFNILLIVVVLWNLEMPIAHRSSFVGSYSIIVKKYIQMRKKHILMLFFTENEYNRLWKEGFKLCWYNLILKISNHFVMRLH